ncbi:MAG: hypothetical protein V7723_04570 [Sneathiella sp.]|uniref:hypothetical protein n=1 Tax=Sneathiella sp. TaxID=1964365 RepID=UPI0030014F04
MIKKVIATTFAAAALTAVLASPAAAVSVNLISDGGFETDKGLGNNGWGVFDNVGAWARTNGQGIEVQRGQNIGGSSPHGGQQKIELDSHNLDDKGQPKNYESNSAMQQIVSLDAGSYEYSFWYRGRTKDAGTNGIGYRIADADNDESIFKDEVTGVKKDGWVQYIETFSLSEATNVAFWFEATGKQDTYGGYLDDVRLSAVPIPAALPLFGAALLGMGFLARRRKQKTALQA